MRHCWKRKCELISDILLWTPIHQCTSIGQPTRFIYISSVWTQDIVWKTCQVWWIRGMDGVSKSGKSMLAAWHDDIHIYAYTLVGVYSEEWEYFCFFLHQFINFLRIRVCPVGWGCRTHWELFYRRRRLRPHECPAYDAKKSDGEVRVILELQRRQCTPSLPSLPGPLWPGVVEPDKLLSVGQIELKCVLKLNWIV